jgi:hypothetical protein
MSPQQIQTAAPPFAAALFALAVLLFLLSLRYFRKSRTDFYWRRRRSAGQRGWRMLVWSIVFMLVSGVICMGAGISGLVTARNSTPTAVVVIATDIPLSTMPSTNTPPPNTTAALPTSSATVTTVVTASATGLATELALPAVTAPAVTGLESSVTPSVDARIDITALDTQISPKFEPVAPGNLFASSFKRIYYFVNFSGLQSGVLWRRELLEDGKLIESIESLWGLAEQGTGYFYFDQESGFKPGYYEVRLFIGKTDRPAASVGFQVK